MGGIDVKVRYVRQTPSGFYWEPSRKVRALGFHPEPLGAEPAAALSRARELNQQVTDALGGQLTGRGTTPAEGSVAALVIKYKASKRWAKLARSTQRGYSQCLHRIERKCGHRPIEAMTRAVVKAWQETLEARAPSFAAAIIRVLRVLLVFAADEGFDILPESYARLDLHTAGGHSEPWEDWEVSAYLDEAKRQGRQSMALAAMLAVCLGRREGDVLRMPRSAYNKAEGVIYLAQQKTDKRLGVVVLPELRREIDLTPAKGTIFVISEKSGRPYGENHFRHLHRQICRSAGIPENRQFMHLRHTAATRLGRAGCTDEEIRSITGHRSRAMVERYVKPDTIMARSAIAKLQAHRNGPK